MNLKSEERIYNFRKDIIDGPNYVCFSCKRGLFKSSVQFLDSNAISALKTKHNLENGFFRELGVNKIEGTPILKLAKVKRFKVLWTYLLLSSYYRYSTYKCYRSDF